MCIEYAGDAIRALSMEGRMTVCNMSIEGGARAGLIAPDDKTFAYLEGPPDGAEGRGSGTPRCAIGRRCQSDEGAHFDHEVRLDAAALPPIVTWGTSPEDVVPITGHVPRPRRHRRRGQAALQGARAGLYGPDRRHQDHRHPDRPRLHRLLHQRPHRGSARRGESRRGQDRQRQRQRHRRAGLRPGEGAGRGRRPRQDLHRRPASNGASRAARCAWR